MPTKYKKNPKTGLYSTLIWDGTYTSDGKKHRKQLTSRKSSADLEKQVYAFKKEVEERVRQSGAGQTSVYTFGEYLIRWMVATKSGFSEHTKQSYKYMLGYFDPISEVPLSDVTLYDIQTIINNNIDRPYACQRISFVFSQVIRFAVKEHLLPSSAVVDLCGVVTLPKRPKPKKRALLPHEKQALFAADLDEWERAFVSLLYFCGLRRSEALALTVSDFDFSKQNVSISKNLTILNRGSSVKESTKTERGLRVVPIPDDAVRYIKPFVDKRTGPVFYDDPETFREYDYHKIWDKIVKKMQQVSPEPIEGLTAHIFRHNYVSELCYQVPKISTKMIARLIGDNENMVLEVYSHIMEERENPVDVINSIFSNKNLTT